MIPKNFPKNLIYIAVLILIVGLVINITVDFSQKEEKKIFPGILGDMVLRNNETGIYFIRNIVSYDDFRGNITQGYKANYTSSNGSMIIFIAETPDNKSANIYLKDMVKRAGYDPNIDYINNTDVTNLTVVKLPVDNPEVYMVQKDRNYTWHYTFAKFDKVYWVGFSDPDIKYQAGMLIEVYRNVDGEIL